MIRSRGLGPTTTPGYGQGDGAPPKISSKGVTSITAKRGSKEQHRTAPAERAVRPPRQKSRTFVGFGEHIMLHPATPATKRALGLSKSLACWAGNQQLFDSYYELTLSPG